MKEAIESNYGILIDNLITNNKVYTFHYNNEIYLFSFFNRSLEELKEILDCCDSLKQFNITPLIFIPNNRGYIITTINNQNYVLLKSINNYSDIVDLEEIMNNNKIILNNNYRHLFRNNWAALWSEKLDYYEYQVNEVCRDKTAILESVGYYIGLATNAIALVNACRADFNKDVDRIVLSHRRIFYPNYRLNYYNPLSFIFDLEVRDIAEYIKCSFFSDNDALLDLSTYLKSVKLTKYSYQMLYARLLYPSYYFDVYDKIINSDLDQDNIVKIVKRVDEYELFLKKAYLEISKYAMIDKIDWIVNLKEH